MRRSVTVFAIVCVVVLLLGGAYVGGYYWRTEAYDTTESGVMGPTPMRLRTFRTGWERSLWRPMASVESRLIGRPVESFEFIEAPELELTTVRTTVRVPDKGTLLLGGSRLVSEPDPRPDGPQTDAGDGAE